MSNFLARRNPSGSASFVETTITHRQTSVNVRTSETIATVLLSTETATVTTNYSFTQTSLRTLTTTFKAPITHTPTPTPQKHNTSLTGGEIGGIIGGAVGAALIFLVIGICLVRRRKRNPRPADEKAADDNTDANGVEPVRTTYIGNESRPLRPDHSVRRIGPNPEPLRTVPNPYSQPLHNGGGPPWSPDSVAPPYDYERPMSTDSGDGGGGRTSPNPTQAAYASPHLDRNGRPYSYAAAWTHESAS